MIKVINEVETFADKDSHDKHDVGKVYVTSHPSDDTMVTLTIGEKTYKVVAKDMISAVENAVNCARH